MVRKVRNITKTINSHNILQNKKKIIIETYATDSASPLSPDKSFQKPLLYPSEPANIPTMNKDTRIVTYLNLS
jgi:hypothetical protein